MRRGILIGLCLASASLVALEGCGGSSADTPAASTSAAGAPAAKEDPGTADGPAPTRPKPHVVVPGGPPPKHLVKRDLIVGSGATAGPGDEVAIQYVGALFTSGETFDSSSWTASSPLSFTLGGSGITKGWSRGMTGMRVGGRRELVIPPQLAYGDERVGPVPPNSTLVYVIDLIAIG